MNKLIIFIMAVSFFTGANITIIFKDFFNKKEYSWINIIGSFAGTISMLVGYFILSIKIVSVVN